MSFPKLCVVFAVSLFSFISAIPLEPETEDNSPDGALGQVIFVNVLYRHGDRTPVDPYPKDPYRDPKYWTTGWGQLTTVGMRQHYELGKWLRDRYKSLLPNDYSRDDILIQSTDVDRTLMSAMSNLAGMYPPNAKHEFEDNVLWQPIPVHTIPENMDGVVAMKKPCPRYNDELSKLKNSPEIKTFENKYKDVFDYLTENTGTEVQDLKRAEYIHNTLFIEELKNLTLPEWTKKVYPEPLYTIAKKSFLLATYTPDLGRLKSGPLLGQMLDNFHLKIDHKMKPDRKMNVYSAHDTTIANLLNTLKVFDSGCPPYASAVLLELRKKGDDHFVALHYRNSSSTPYLLAIPGCSQYCPIDKFETLVRPVIPENWEKECHYNSLFSTSDFSAITLGALVVCFVALVCLLGVVLLQRRRYRDSYFRYHTVSTNIN